MTQQPDNKDGSRPDANQGGATEKDAQRKDDAALTQEEAKQRLSGVLKRARLETGRDLGDLAYEINIPQSTLNDLEAGTLYDRMTKVFVRGYILAYAKILKLEERELLALLDRVYAPAEEASPKTSSAVELRRNGLTQHPFVTSYEHRTAVKKERAARMNVLFPILLCVLVLGAVVYWKLFIDVGEEPEPENPVVLDLETTVAPPQEEEEEEPPIFFETDIVEEEESTEANTSDETLLEFIFNEESWLEVSDSLGEEITWQIYGPGERVSFRGVPPYRIVVGNAPGTIVRYAGQELDLVSYTRNRVARVQVPLPAP